MKIRIILFCASIFLVNSALASSGGIFNTTPSNGSACISCHTAEAFNYSTLVTGPATVAPGGSAAYTIALSKAGGGNASRFGFSLEASSGSIAAGTGSKISGSDSKDLTHSASSSTGSWGFTWNAPSSVGSHSFSYCGNPVDNASNGELGDGSSNANACRTTNITVNSNPTANNDAASHDEDSGNKTISPLSNDTAGGTGDTKTLVGVCSTGTSASACTGSSHNPGSPGSLSVSGSNIIYTPAANYNGVFSFQYRMRDSFSVFDNATVTVTVSADNDQPVISGVNTTLAYNEDDGARILEASVSLSDVDNTQLNRAQVEISANYVSGEDVLAVGSCSGLSSCAFSAGTGILTLSGTASLATYEAALQSITYTNGSQTPSDSTRTVRYRVRDTGNLYSSYDSMIITVSPSNDLPIISGANTTLSYMEGMGAQALESSISISDVDSTQLNRAQIDLATNYASGEDILAATNCVGLSCSFNPGTGTLTISGNASLAAYETAIESITYTNDSQNPSTATRTVRYDVRDTTNVTSAIDSMLITVARVEDPANFDSPVYNRIGTGTSSATAQTIIEDATIQLQFAATDPEGISTTYNLVSTSPALVGPEPLITVSSGGLLSWTPDGTRSSVQVVVGVNDNVGSSPDNTFSITLNVTATNDAPVIAEGASTLVNMDEDNNPTGFSLTLNAADLDGDTITWSIFSQGSKGSAAASGTGTSKVISYTPTLNQNGADSFIVRATDNVDSDDIRVNVNIAEQPDNPIITEGGSTTVNMSEDGVPTAFGLTLNATDPDGETITWEVLTQGSKGTASTSGTGSSKSIAYAINSNVSGPDSFVVRATDSTARTDDITVNVNIAAVNDAPTLNAIAPQITDEFTAQNATAALQFIVSGSDTEGESLSFSLDAASLTAGASITPINNTTAQFSYLPQTGADDLPNVTVTVTDGQEVYAPAITRSFSITVNEVNDQPILAPINTSSTTEISLLQITMPVVDEDDSTANLVFGLDAASLALGISVNTSGQISWTPGENTVDTGNSKNFTVTASVQDGLQNNSVQQTRTFTITVNKLDTDADTIADYNDVCPAISDVDQADNDSDWEKGVANTSTTGGDLCDTDDDNDTMLDSYEIANGLDPFDAADASLDNDGDGLTNAEEAALGSDPNADNVPPVITANTLNINATAVLTAVEFAVSAIDTLDGRISVTTNDDTGPFLSGVHTITWRAEDSSGNSTTLDQSINIAPIASVAASQLSGEGDTLNITVLLSGPAAVYPVEVNYTVAGTATQPADHNLSNGSLSIAKGLSGNISVQVASDVLTEGDEEIVLTLSTANNATIGMQHVQTVTIVEQQLPPSLQISASQAAVNTNFIYKDQGIVVLTAHAEDANNDPISFDWSAATSVSFNPPPTAISSTVAFDPSGLAIGIYNIPITINDGYTSVSGSINLLLEDSAPLLTGVDSDGDGINDDVEGRADTDGDLVPDYLDPIDQVNLINTYVSPLENNYLNAMQTEVGLSLKLGRSAIAAKTSGTQVSLDDIQKGSLDTISIDSEYTQISSLFDFEVHGLNVINNTAKIAIPLALRLPSNAVYRKYEPGTGWNNFVEDSQNAIKSAYRNNGICPSVLDTAYMPGLQLLADCIELTISDGGANDADGMVNGSILDPGGISIPNSATPDELVAENRAQTNASNSGSSAGGISAINIIFLSLLILMGLYPIVNKNKNV